MVLEPQIPKDEPAEADPLRPEAQPQPAINPVDDDNKDVTEKERQKLNQVLRHTRLLDKPFAITTIYGIISEIESPEIVEEYKCCPNMYSLSIPFQKRSTYYAVKRYIRKYRRRENADANQLDGIDDINSNDDSRDSGCVRKRKWETGAAPAVPPDGVPYIFRRKLAEQLYAAYAVRNEEVKQENASGYAVNLVVDERGVPHCMNPDCPMRHELAELKIEPTDAPSSSSEAESKSSEDSQTPTNPRIIIKVFNWMRQVYESKMANQQQGSSTSPLS